MIRHFHFFEALAVIPEETIDFEVILSGLMLLRLVDGLNRVPTTGRAMRPSYRLLRQQLQRLPPSHPVQIALMQCIDDMDGAETWMQQVIQPHLKTYAHIIGTMGYQGLAMDFLNTVCETPHR